MDSEAGEAELPDVAEKDVPKGRKRKRNPKPGNKTTSWEVYNVFLRQLVDQLIGLGASKDMKIVAFQLWACYLRQCGVAFVSKDEKTLPALSSLGFRNEDVRILYGIKNLRQKIFTKKRKRSNSNPSDEDLENNAEQEDGELNDSTTTDRQTQSEEQFNSQFKRKKGIAFSSSTSKVLKEISEQISESSERTPHPKMDSKTRYKIRRVAYDRRFHNKSVQSPSSTVTVVTLLTIIRVALQIIGDEIYLSDILRWMCEGRISFNQPHEKISSCNINIQYHLMNLKWSTLMMDIRNFTRSLKIKRLPTPNLFHIAERYCEELNLPNEFLQLVLKLMVVSNVTMDYSNYAFKSFPDYECRVMAFIIFTFKLTCSLDDVTEHYLSDFADLVNDIRSTGDVPATDIPKLFSWRKWARFVECRKAVLAMHHVPANNLSYDDGVLNSNIFLDYWDKVNSPYQAIQRKIKPEIVSYLKKECRSLFKKNFETEADCIHYPVSFTPFKTYTEHLIANHRELLQRPSRKILSEDFSADSVNMAGNSQWYLDISEKVGIKLKVIDPAKYFETKNVVIKNQSLLALSKTTNPRPDTQVSVFIEDDEQSETISNDEITGFEPEIHQPELNSKRSRRRSVKVFKDLRYWCFHECHKKMAVEEFDQLAINNLPSSFLWLLRECASMLRATPKELYFELMFVEIMLSRLYPENFRQRVTMKVDESEW